MNQPNQSRPFRWVPLAAAYGPGMMALVYAALFAAGKTAAPTAGRAAMMLAADSLYAG